MDPINTPPLFYVSIYTSTMDPPWVFIYIYTYMSHSTIIIYINLYNVISSTFDKHHFELVLHQSHETSSFYMFRANPHEWLRLALKKKPMLTLRQSKIAMGNPYLPSGKHNYGKSQSLMGKLTINGPSIP